MTIARFFTNVRDVLVDRFARRQATPYWVRANQDDRPYRPSPVANIYGLRPLR